MYQTINKDCFENMVIAKSLSLRGVSIRAAHRVPRVKRAAHVKRSSSRPRNPKTSSLNTIKKTLNFPDIIQTMYTPTRVRLEPKTSSLCIVTAKNGS